MEKIFSQDKEKVEEVLKNALFCHIAFSDKNQPYILPLSFGYKNNVLYFHSGPDGKKMDLLARNPKVAFAIETNVELKEAPTSCKYSMLYKSVTGSGRAYLLEDLEEKARGLDIVVKQYNAEPLEYSEKALQNLAVVKIEIEEISYKETRIS